MVDNRRVLGDRYWLSAGLGQGSMAEVYRALDLELGRPVAIKRLKPEFAADAAARTAMVREGELLGRVRHPGVVRVLEVGEFAATGAVPTLPYLVLELVPGRTLGSLVARGEALDPDVALAVADRLLDALAGCHAAGVLHRDIKPANVVLTEEGEVKLVDFGIACLEAEASETAVPAVRGTVKYMAPERLCAATVDARSDLYSVGVLLYQLLLGRPPFVGDVPTVVDQHLRQSPAPVSRVNPALGDRFDVLLLTALAKDPADRYASAEEMRGAVTKLTAPAQACRGGSPVAPQLLRATAATGSGVSGARAVAVRSTPPRRQLILAAALAAAVLPAVGFLVLPDDPAGVGLTSAGAAAALQTRGLDADAEDLGQSEVRRSRAAAKTAQADGQASTGGAIAPSAGAGQGVLLRRSESSVQADVDVSGNPPPAADGTADLGQSPTSVPSDERPAGDSSGPVGSGTRSGTAAPTQESPAERPVAVATPPRRPTTRPDRPEPESARPAPEPTRPASEPDRPAPRPTRPEPELTQPAPRPTRPEAEPTQPAPSPTRPEPGPAEPEPEPKPKPTQPADPPRPQQPEPPRTGGQPTPGQPGGHGGQRPAAGPDRPRRSDAPGRPDRPGDGHRPERPGRPGQDRPDEDRSGRGERPDRDQRGRGGDHPDPGGRGNSVRDGQDRDQGRGGLRNLPEPESTQDSALR